MPGAERRPTGAVHRAGLARDRGLVDDAWLDGCAVTAEFVERSRELTESNVVFDLDAGHSADEPRLRRLSSPTDLHETYWEFASQSAIVDVAVDLLGPDVKFHHSKLNFKAPHGGEEVKWHQDIQFWPHTNYDLLTIGVFLEDVEPGMGEVGFVPGQPRRSALRPLRRRPLGRRARRRRRRARRRGTGRVSRSDRPARSRCTTAGPCTAPRSNRSDRARPLLLQTYAAADALSYTDLVRRSPHGEELIRGNPPRWARHDPRPCLLPPSGPYRPIFAAQQRED